MVQGHGATEPVWAVNCTAWWQALIYKSKKRAQARFIYAQPWSLKGLTDVDTTAYASAASPPHSGNSFGQQCQNQYGVNHRNIDTDCSRKCCLHNSLSPTKITKPNQTQTQGNRQQATGNNCHNIPLNREQPSKATPSMCLLSNQLQWHW
jgi:hypothetical protein